MNNLRKFLQNKEEGRKLDDERRQRHGKRVDAALWVFFLSFISMAILAILSL